MAVDKEEDFSQLLNDYQIASKYRETDRSRNFTQQPKNFYGQGGAHKCMTCDFSFRSREMLFNHLSTHVTCDHDDCDFVGVAQAVSKHKREEHEQPESLTVFTMDHPAILQAWLEQRRKNFPSSGNLKLKQLREQAKTDHGIIAREKSYTFKDNKWGVKRHKPCIPKTEKPSSPDKPPPDDPLSFILGSGDEKQKTGPARGILGMGAYDSSSGSETEEVSVKTADPPHEKEKEPNVEQALRKFKRYAKMRSADGKRKRERVKWNGVMKSGRRRFQPTLLQKLLARDIVMEHNTVLQCVRYIVNNNFFDEPQTISNDEPQTISNDEPQTFSNEVESTVEMDGDSVETIPTESSH